MPEFDPTTIAMVALGLAAGGLVKGVTGLGLPIVALPILTTVMEVPAAISVMLVSMLLTNVVQAWRTGRVMWAVRRFWTLALGVAVGTIIGGNLSAQLESRWLYSIVAGCMLAFAGLGFSRFEPRVPETSRVWLSPMVGLSAGVLGGMSTMFGPPFVIYMAALRVPKEEFVASISMFMLVGSVCLGGTYSALGLLGEQAWLASFLAFVPALIGLQLGAWVRDRIDQERFRKVVYLALILLSLNLLRRAFF
ncbi:MAG: sulfite exporter TauE/SafE family protein [Alphaproteobacteria bacterium]|nr:sulfite exporter TauE/SafE family protein [Alphaproteobacteria bacterium]